MHLKSTNMKLINVFDYLSKTDEQGDYVNDGASYNLNTGEFNPNEGYFVSLVGYEEEVDIPTNPNKWQDAVLSWASRTRAFSAIGVEMNVFFDFWLHDGKLYLNLSEKIMNRDEAVRQGYARNQISIYNANDGTYIYMSKVSSDPDLTTDKHY